MPNHEVRTTTLPQIVSEQAPSCDVLRAIRGDGDAQSGFSDIFTPSPRRQRRFRSLVLASLIECRGVVDFEELSEMVGPLNRSILSRTLAGLVEDKLVEEGNGGYCMALRVPR